MCFCLAPPTLFALLFSFFCCTDSPKAMILSILLSGDARSQWKPEEGGVSQVVGETGGNAMGTLCSWSLRACLWLQFGLPGAGRSEMDLHRRGSM